MDEFLTDFLKSIIIIIVVDQEWKLFDNQASRQVLA